MGFDAEEMGKILSDGEWNVEVDCLNPARTRVVGRVRALSEDQATVLAEAKVKELFGEVGQGWRRFRVQANST